MTDDDALHHLKESCYCSSCQRAIEHLRSALLSHAEVVKERDGLRAQLELIHPEAGHLAHAEAYTKLESENYALRAEVVTLKQEISGNDSAHRLLLAEVERLKKGNEMVNQLLGEMTGKRDALKARLAEVQSLVEAALRLDGTNTRSFLGSLPEKSRWPYAESQILDIIEAKNAYRAAQESKGVKK